MAAMFPGAALYFTGVAGQNKCVLPSSFLLLFKDWCQNCAVVEMFLELHGLVMPL